MEATTLITAAPEQMVAMFRAAVQEEVAKIQPVVVAAPDELLTKKQVMQMLDIDSEKGFQAWCKRNKVFGRRTGKGNMYLRSKILGAFA